MTFEWDLPPIMAVTRENVRLAERTVESVLLEYDGPQLVVLRERDERYLGYVADEFPGGLRWLHVPVTGVELKALHRGKLTLREALEKSEVMICDVADSGEVGRVWLSPPASIPSECLPERGIELPEFARDPQLAAPRETLAFECEGGGVRGHTITYRCLGALTQALQRLWDHLASSRCRRRRSLRMGQEGPLGSRWSAGR